MSVTFTCWSAPTKQVPCPFCRDWPDSMKDPTTGRCDDHCTGFTDESEAPECNFANDNARGVLSLLGLYQYGEDDLYGSLKPDQLGTYLQKLMVLLNVDKKRVDLIESPWEDQTPGQCRIISAGNTDEQTVRRLTALQDLFLYASQNQFEVTWS